MNVDPLPFQLYLSVSAPDKKTYMKIIKPINNKLWNNFNQTLELLASLNTRKVLRITLIKGLNMNKPEKYANMIKKSKPDFVEVKAYEWVGESQRRLPKNSMPYMDDVENFTKKIMKV